MDAKPKLSISTFDQLQNSELYEILRLRSAIFVVEQECPYQDLDGLDADSLHLKMEVAGKSGIKLVGYSRLLASGLAYDNYCSFGRVVVPIEERGKGYGRYLTRASIDACREKFPGKPIKIMAQSYLLKLYTDFGFIKAGQEFLEDGISHRYMVLK